MRIVNSRVIYLYIGPKNSYTLSHMDYVGVIIEESLENSDILKQTNILKTVKKKVTPKEQTPWLTQWSLHTVRIPDRQIDHISREISKLLLTVPKHAWYADFKNDSYHFIVFPNKVFKVDIHKPQLYKDAREYGVSLGIPGYQMQFERLIR